MQWKLTKKPAGTIGSQTARAVVGVIGECCELEYLTSEAGARLGTLGSEKDWTLVDDTTGQELDPTLLYVEFEWVGSEKDDAPRDLTALQTILKYMGWVVEVGGYNAG